LVKIRLQRHGRKQLPYYHLVAADSRSRRDGRIIEDLGRYSPTEQPAMVKVKTDRIVYWLNTGAQPTDTVRSILKKEGIYLRLHLTRWGKTEEEIEAAVAEFKEARAEKKSSSSIQRRAALKQEEDTVKKLEVARQAEAEKKAKADAEAAKLAADEAAAAAAAAAPVAEEAPAAEEVVAEASAEVAAAEETPAADDTAETKEA